MALSSLLVGMPLQSALADSGSFSEDFEAYEAGSNLAGQSGWDGSSNQGTPSEMPVTEGSLLPGSQVLNTRAIASADRIHQVGHALPALAPNAVTTLAMRAYADSNSVNSGIGLGENPLPGSEIATEEGFFADYRTGWYSYADGWAFDLRGIAGNDLANFFPYPKGLGQEVALRIVVDGPSRRVYGEMEVEGAVIVTPSRSVTAAQVAALDAIAIFSDVHEAGREGIELDDLVLTARKDEGARPCGDVNANGTLTASDALLVLRGAVGQPVDLHCPAPARTVQTGQETCWKADGTAMECEGSGQDGEVRAGASRAFFDNGDGTILDAATGLVWEKLGDDGGIHDADATWNWPDGFATKVAMLNAGKFAGADDWRMPNVVELETLAHLSASSPATWGMFFSDCTPGCSATACSCTRDTPQWTSTTYAQAPAQAWAVRFTDGARFADHKSSATYAVRAVRGGD